MADSISRSGAHVVICAPMSGTLIPLEEIADGVFSEMTIGPGVAVVPNEGIIYAPFNGEITMIYNTKHVLVFMSDEGVELMVHIGIDTVKLRGEPFDIHVSVGERVNTGDKIGTFDIAAIERAGCSLISPVIITNSCELGSVAAGTPMSEVQAGEPILFVN